MNGKVMFMLMLLVLSNSTVLQVILQPSNNNSIDLQFSYCHIQKDMKVLSLINQQYFKQIRQVIPLKGDHFVSKMAEFYQSTGSDLNSHSFLNDKMGIFKFSILSITGIGLLLFFFIQFVIGLLFSDIHSSCNKKIELCLLIIAIVGFGISTTYVIFNSVEGFTHISDIKEGFDQLTCSNDLLRNFHIVDKRIYSMYQLPDIIEELETTVFGIRMKVNRLIWHSNGLLQNPKQVKELIDMIKSINNGNQTVGKDVKNQELIKNLNQFNQKYSDLSQGLAKNTEDDDISHWYVQEKVFKMWESIRSIKISWSYVRTVLKNTVAVSGDLFSQQTQSQFIWLLKIVYTVSIVITLVAALGIYFIRLHKSNFLKSALVFVLITISLIAFVNALILSVMLPYIAWGCEGGNYILQSESNFIEEIKNGHADPDTMTKALHMFSPYNTNKLGNIVRKESKDYFVALNKTVEQFLKLKGSIPQLLKDLYYFVQKYADKKQNIEKINKVQLGLSQNSFQGLNVFHSQLQSLIRLIDTQNGAFGSLVTSRVGTVFKNNVNSMCIANFNNLYEIRKRMNQIGYGLLCALIFLSIVRITSITQPTFKLDDLEESRVMGLKQVTETNINAKQPYNPSGDDD